jgi:micrococcal nuclease
MRLFSLILLSLVGLSPIAGNAGTLVGNWLQDDPDDASLNERRAISQPITQSTEATRVTLGIKSPGTTDLVDFFLIFSNKTAGSSCQYTVAEVIIDSKSFPVSSATHSSNISGLRNRTTDEQKQIWKAFRKGQKLSLRIRQVCNVENVASSEINSFAFSLKGSSAAYRFVAGLEAIDTQDQQKVAIKEPADDPAPEDDEIVVEDETSQSILFPLLGALLIVVLLVKLFKSRANQDSIDSTFDPVSERLDPDIGDHSHIQETNEASANDFQITPATNGASSFDSTQIIANLPQYKVDHVIDGDTVIVSSPGNELKIRLDSIDCPEDGQEWGEIATAGLIKLIGGKHVHLEEHKIDRYERTVATLYVRHDNDPEWLNVNERMITLGHAWVMRRFYEHLPKHRQDKLNRLERWAKSKRVGLWKADNPIPPWEWRNDEC